MARPTVAHLGPAGTHSEEALLAAAGGEVEPRPCATIHDAIAAVGAGEAQRAFVPIENSLEGGIAVTLDALADPGAGVRIAGEAIHPVHHHLLARAPMELAAVRRVLSHPQASGQCARFLRGSLPGAEVVAASSTADAARSVAASGEPWAAVGSQLAAEIYGCAVLAREIEDRPDNQTRFVWLAPAGEAGEPGRPAKTSIVFWGFNDESPGSLVAVLGELADRGVNLTRIESRPRRVRLGHYMFFADLEGAEHDEPVAAALRGLAARVETLRVLGSYRAAARPAG